MASGVRPLLRAVLFDWGDTLFHSPDAAAVIVSYAREHGVPVSRPDATALWDELWTAGKTPEEIAKGRDLSTEAHRRVWTDLFGRADRVAPGLSRVLYEKVMDPNAWLPFADTGPVLRALRERGLRIGVVINVPAELRTVFAKHGLDRYVDAFTLSYEVGVQKPDPAIFTAAADALGVRPEETLMVGDHPVDAGAGRVGMRVFILPEEFDGDVRGLNAVLALVN